MDAGEQADEIVLPAQREHCIDQVVADACLALLDFETVRKKISDLLRGIENRFINRSNFSVLLRILICQRKIVILL